MAIAPSHRCSACRRLQTSPHVGGLTPVTAVTYVRHEHLETFQSTDVAWRRPQRRPGPRRGPRAARRGEVLRRRARAELRARIRVAGRHRSTRSSARTAPASRRWSRSSPACTAATAASCCSTASAVDFGSTAESKAAGVAVIYQEPTLFPDLSVTENIFMGRQSLGSGRRIDRGAMYAEAESLFAGLGVHIDPRRPALGLSIADQQIIEIAKAISLDARVLIMDEPTAALSGVEVERLFAVARSLRDEGRALVFISHRFDEVFDAVRHGHGDARRRVRRHARRSARPSIDEIVALMVGREVGDLFPKTPAEIGEPVLEVRGLSSRPASSTTSASRSGPARSSASPGWSAPVAARSPARSSASTATTRGSVRLAGKPVPGTPPARGDPRRDGVHPRGPPQAGPGHRGLGRPQRRRRDPRRPHPGRAAHPARREPGSRPVGRPSSRSRPTPSTPTPPR